MNSKKRSDVIVIAYVPTIHSGYLKLFHKYEGSIIYIFGDEIISEFTPLVRNLPSVKSEESRKMIQSLGIFSDVRIFSRSNIEEVCIGFEKIVMPDEDVSHSIATKYLRSHESQIFYDGQWRLRWDWGTVQEKRRPEKEHKISFDEFDRDVMRVAFKNAGRSSDWWRQIGAVLVKDGSIILVSFNKHVPSEQSLYCYGDPRSLFNQGEFIELSSSIHAEAAIVAKAANRGISMKKCDLYVTTFPCPPCAYLVAHTGIGRLFYAEGYSIVAGAEVLLANGIEIIRVEVETE